MSANKFTIRNIVLAPDEEWSSIIDHYLTTIRFDVRGETIHVYIDSKLLDTIHESYLSKYGKEIGKYNKEVIREFAVIPIILIQEGILDRKYVTNLDLKKVIRNAIVIGNSFELDNAFTNQYGYLLDDISLGLGALPIRMRYGRSMGIPYVGVKVFGDGKTELFMKDNLMIFHI